MTRHPHQVANVSSSGYYKWLQNKEKHTLREEADYLLLKSLYDQAKGKIGYRGFSMALVDVLDTPMNHKKILRLMRKFNLYAKIRRANPCRLLEKQQRRIAVYRTI